MHSSCGRLREQHDQCSPWHGRLKRRKKKCRQKKMNLNMNCIKLWSNFTGTNNTNRILNVTWKVQISAISWWSRGNYGMKTLEEVIFRMLLVSYPETIHSPSEEKAQDRTGAVWLVRVWSSFMVQAGVQHTSKMRPKLNCVCIRSWLKLTEVQKKK